jgi:hypothetical protein
MKHESANITKNALALSGTDRIKQVTVHSNNKRTTGSQSAKDAERKSICQKDITALSTDKPFHCCIIAEVGIMRLCTTSLTFFRFWTFPSHSISKTTPTLVFVNMPNSGWHLGDRRGYCVPPQKLYLLNISIYIHN